MPETMAYDPLGHDNINAYRDLINSNCQDENKLKNSIIKICKEIYSVEWYLEMLIEKREDKLTFIERSFL